jgi:hypothetical protein
VIKKNTYQSRIRATLGTGFFALFLFAGNANAQNAVPASLYEQSSELTTSIVGYGQDMKAISDFYNPYTANRRIEYQYNAPVVSSPEQRKRQLAVANGYLGQLALQDFSNLSIYGKVDYTLLKKQLRQKVKNTIRSVSTSILPAAYMS